MTEFKLEPIKQVIIHDLIHESFDNFLQQCATLGITSVQWVDGVMIYLSTLSRFICLLFQMRKYIENR